MSNDQLEHVGVKRRSGRYPWGSGEDPYQGQGSFLGAVSKLRKEGFSDTEIAEGFGISTTTLRARYSVERNAKRAEDRLMVQKLKEKGMSNTAIAERLNTSEGTVRNFLDETYKERADILGNTMDTLKERVNEVGCLDVGPASNLYLGVSDQKFKTAIAGLKDEGYEVQYIKVEQPGKPGAFTTIKTLAKPGTPYSETYANRDKIGNVTAFTEDGGVTFHQIKPPVSVSSKRIAVKYGDEGGSEMDGIIELRRGVDDIALGNSRYAQIRMAVDGTHYLKGMAVYSDDLPDGVDIRFNTNKKSTGNKLDAMKNMSDDEDRPFGAVIKKQHYYTDAKGKLKQSTVNVVNEEGDWNDWSSTLSSQMLSKQRPSLIQEQLDKARDKSFEDYEKVMALTNPTIRKKLLDSYADQADSDSVHLKAAAMPRQRSQVILPVPTMKDNEVYAPNFKHGESVVLVRYPHGGTFEIPELVVNNKNKQAKGMLGQAFDAVGINSKVAERLSGADFDGDTVLVIPNNSGKVLSTPALKGLKNFDPKTSFPPHDGMRTMDGRVWDAKKGKSYLPEGAKENKKTKQHEMGNISNLITDMTIKGASTDEIARAVRHSMVVIDAEKHGLDYKLSYREHRIADLKAKYQGVGERGNLKGASTLISRASSEKRVPERELRKASEGGPVDPKTGKLVYVPTGKTYVNKAGKTVVKTIKSTKMAETDDAYSLSSGTAREKLYSDYANALKAQANKARLASLNTPRLKYNPSAAKAYSEHVATLQAKLDTALKNKPLERKAQLIADVIIEAKVKDNPGMTHEELKKLKGQAIISARARSGASKTRVHITDMEWEAIQAGAIHDTKLRSIIDNADLEHVQSLAMPRSKQTITSADQSRVKAMAARGLTQGEIAEQIGISVSSVNDLIQEGE